MILNEVKGGRINLRLIIPSPDKCFSSGGTFVNGNVRNRKVINIQRNPPNAKLFARTPIKAMVSSATFSWRSKKFRNHARISEHCLDHVNYSRVVFIPCNANPAPLCSLADSGRWPWRTLPSCRSCPGTLTGKHRKNVNRRENFSSRD